MVHIIAEEGTYTLLEEAARGRNNNLNIHPFYSGYNGGLLPCLSLRKRWPRYIRKGHWESNAFWKFGCMYFFSLEVF